MTSATEETRFRLKVVTDGRRLFVTQVPVVGLHPAVMAALAIPEFGIVEVLHVATGRSLTTWVCSTTDHGWQDCPTPWSGTVRLSLAAWRQILPDTERRSGDALEISSVSRVLPVWPAHIERLLAGNEIGLHKEDAAALGAGKWVIVNHRDIPAVCRVRLSGEERDRGRARLSYQARMLLGVLDSDLGHPEITIFPVPTTRRGRPALVPEPRWVSRRGRRVGRHRIRKAVRSAIERCFAGLLGAPPLVFRTVEAAPGEDQMLTVRVPAELFPLLGTQPGQQVYVEWGPGNRAVATALTAYEPEDGEWPAVRMIGHRPRHDQAVPALARVHVGAATRASLGIPRVTVVTLRRRVTPLVVGKLNELILPATGVSIALTADIKLRPTELVPAVAVVVFLMMAPLRTRRSPLGRVP